MAKAKTETPKIEREYIIPLRDEIRKVQRYRRAEKVIKAVKEFIVRHMKIYDRDIKKIKMDSYLNEYLWGRGMKNPPTKVKVKAIKEGDVVKVELVDYPEKLKFKKLREERLMKAAEEVGKKKKEEKKAEEVKPETPEEKTEEEKTKEEEKKAAVVETGKEMEKAAAKKMKHQSFEKNQPKHQRRMALQK